MAKRLQLPPTEILAAEYVAGSTYAQIAARYCVSLSSVRTRLLAANVTPRPRGERPPPASALAAVTALHPQLTLRQIAARLGLSYETVRSRLRAAGVDTSRPARDKTAHICARCGVGFAGKAVRKYCSIACYGDEKRKVSPETLRRDRDAGLTIAAMASKHSVSLTTVARYLTGYPLPGRAAALAATLERDYLPAPVAAELLCVDPGTLDQALREQHVPGAFLWYGIWCVPRVGLAEYDQRQQSSVLIENPTPK